MKAGLVVPSQRNEALPDSAFHMVIFDLMIGFIGGCPSVRCRFLPQAGIGGGVHQAI